MTSIVILLLLLIIIIIIKWTINYGVLMRPDVIPLPAVAKQRVAIVEHEPTLIEFINFSSNSSSNWRELEVSTTTLYTIEYRLVLDVRLPGHRSPFLRSFRVIVTGNERL